MTSTVTDGWCEGSGAVAVNFEDAGSKLDELSADDRIRLAQVIREVADREPDGRRQAPLLETPDRLGLEDSDDE